MNLKFATGLIVIGSLLIPTLAAAADTDTDRTHPLTYVKDSVITTKIKAKLADEKMSSLTKIRVDTDSKGEVSLSGRVPTQDAADKAVAIARATEGVTAVTSTIKIKKED
jgi:hyperosmotically inducible protein